MQAHVITQPSGETRLDAGLPPCALGVNGREVNFEGEIAAGAKTVRR